MHSLNLFSHLLVLPTIVPFSFGQDELNLDESISATCSITKGDLPLKIWWTFTGEENYIGFNLTTNDGIVITKTNQKLACL